MQNYRKVFLLAILGNVVLLGILVGIWRHKESARTTKRHAAPASNAATPPAESSNASPAPTAEAPLAPVPLSAERLQSIGVKFGAVERKDVADEIRVNANVAMDETRISYVQTRFSGYIGKVYADATYQYVREGQPLFTIYSPELAAAEREYLVAKQNERALAQSTVPGVSAGIQSLLKASADRLKQWNIPQREIARLETSGQVQQEIEIDSPVSGYITERNALPNLTVQPDTRLYAITDLSTVWVFAQIFQNDLGRIHAGDSANLTVDSYPGRTFRGRVGFIYPDVEMTTRTARVRLVFANPGLALKPGMFVNVDLRVPLGTHLVIPTDAALQTGTRQIVFVDRGDGYLEPRDVQLGAQAGDQYIVLKGLKAGERIVTSANFLIDSESQLQAAIGTFVPPPPGAGAAAAMNGQAKAPAATLEFSTEPSTPRKGNNLYRVKLNSPDGAPISGAQVSVRSFMPGMPEMGMAAVKVLTALRETSRGVYEGQAKLESGGTWQLTITATKKGTAFATKQLSINVQGGMQP